MKTAETPYYPPRVGRFRRSLPRWYGLRRALALERIAPISPDATRSRLALWLLIPGTFMRARGFRLSGTIYFSVWFTLIAAGCIGVGLAWASWAFIIASTMHTLSAVMAWVSCLTHLSRGQRVWRGALYGFLLTVMIYNVLGPYVARRIVLPIQLYGESYLVNTSAPLSGLKRGEWITYHYNSYFGHGGNVLRVNFDRVLALPGETIRFYPEAFEVGGIVYQRISNTMPVSGEITLENSVCYVWPVNLQRNPWDRDDALLKATAIVPLEQVTGKAYHRWFWRKQALDPLIPMKNWTPPSAP